MGFSTSGSLLLIFASLFIAIGSLYTVAANTGERMAQATDAQDDRFRTVQRTQVNVTNATWDTGETNLTVSVNNTGETTLDVQHVDVVVDGEYLGTEDFERVEVEGVDSDVWRPGEQLVLEDEDSVAGVLSPPPSRVKVVTGPGVADTTRIEEVST